MDIKRLKETGGTLHMEVSSFDIRMGLDERMVKGRAYAELRAHLHEACRECEHLRHREEPNMLRDTFRISVGCVNKAPHCPDENPFMTTKIDLLGKDMPIHDMPFNPDELHHLMMEPVALGDFFTGGLLTGASAATSAIAKPAAPMAGPAITSGDILDAMKYASTSGSLVAKDDDTGTAVGVLGLIQRGWTLQCHAGRLDEVVTVDGRREMIQTVPNRFVLTKPGMMDREVTEAVAREALDFMEKAQTGRRSEEERLEEERAKAAAQRQAKQKAEEERRLQAQLKEVEQEAVKEQLEDLGFGSW